MSEAQDELLAMMRASGIAVTRENYIDVAWGQPLPEEWTPEEELQLPAELQDFTLFEMVDGEMVLKKGAYPNAS